MSAVRGDECQFQYSTKDVSYFFPSMSVFEWRCQHATWVGSCGSQQCNTSACQSQMSGCKYFRSNLVSVSPDLLTVSRSKLDVSRNSVESHHCLYVIFFQLMIKNQHLLINQYHVSNVRMRWCVYCQLLRVSQGYIVSLRSSSVVTEP